MIAIKPAAGPLARVGTILSPWRGGMVEKKDDSKRRNRFVRIDEAASQVLDPVFRKRGFANRDLFARWSDIAPTPFGQTTLPERLYWPRRATGAEGAVLILRCAPGAALAVAHESDRLARAVNTYFGYFLVEAVRISVEPFVVAEPRADVPPACPEAIRGEVARQVEAVDDAGLREALRHLGENLKTRDSSGRLQ